MHSRTAKFWTGFPLFFAALQFPWRLNILLCVASLPIIATFLVEAWRVPRVAQVALLGLFGMLLTPWLICYGQIWMRYQQDANPHRATVDDDDGWFPAWSVAGLDGASALRASTGPRARFVTGVGTVETTKWEPRSIIIRTSSATGGRVMISQFYFPSWKATVNGSSGFSTVEAKLPEGLLVLEVPPGDQVVSLAIPTSQSEYLGRWISGLSVVFSLVIAWKLRPQSDYDIADGEPQLDARSSSFQARNPGVIGA
jgi:hypothetical protein